MKISRRKALRLATFIGTIWLTSNDTIFAEEEKNHGKESLILSRRAFFQIYLHHSPSLPQPSAGQSIKSIGCQSPAPVVESRTQARLNQPPHWPQQQWSVSWKYSYLHSSASRFEQWLPGEARPHSDKRYNTQSDSQTSKN